MTIEPGQTLLHYRLVEKIGEGGMGVVWKAEDTKLQRNVALKVLPEAMAADPERRTRFEREARAVAALNHPNIVTLHSVEEADAPTGRVHFITMELVEGRTLTELLPNNGFPLGRLLGIAIPLADAVSRAHRAGITHRDLKPDNIMVDAEDRLRVLDFGLAKLQERPDSTEDTQVTTVTSDTAEGRVLGTVAYMSPEQAEGKDVDARSDIFSLGTMLYEMASGRRPFSGDTRMSTIGAILKDEPSSISELKPSLPRHAGRIIHRCLAKEPDRRYQTALDLRNELEELKGEVDSGLHAAGTLGASAHRRWSARRLVVFGVAPVLAVALLISILQIAGRTEPDREISYTSVPITSGIGQEVGPNWSPEGEFIAFSQVREGTGFDVIVQPVAGGEATVRASGPGDEVNPRWSPDGKYLAYVSTSEPGSPVYLIPPHGGMPRKLINTAVDTLDTVVTKTLGDRPWSPDSRSLLVSHGGAIHRVDRDGDATEQLTFPQFAIDLSASYSFDGERIVFIRAGPSERVLMTMSAAGGKVEPIQENAWDPAFRPDGRHLLFLLAREGGIRNLWELDLVTDTSSQLTFESRHRLNSFSVSASDRIAYQMFWHDTFLFTVDLATGERRQLTSHTRENFGARWSPDGSTIAYQSTRTGNGEIYLHHLDGTPETPVTDDPGLDEYPDWSPDGSQLVFVSNRQDGQRKLFIANSDGGGARLLVDRPVWSAPARWSPDGKRIAFIGGDFSLWTVDPDGDDAKQVVSGVSAFDWYLDSRRGIYVLQLGNQTQLVAIDLKTGEKQWLYTGPLMELDVAPDGSAVSFCHGRGHWSMGIAKLKLVAEPGALPRAAGEPEYVVRAEETWHLHNGGWSPDSKSIVYTRDQDFGDIYELVEKLQGGKGG